MVRLQTTITIFGFLSVLPMMVARADDRPERTLQTTVNTVPDWIAATRPLMTGEKFFGNTQPSAKRLPEKPNDGTWRDEGGFVIINLEGREFRLVKTPTASSNSAGALQKHALPVSDFSARLTAPPTAATAIGGTVAGRLLNRRRPLVGCRVSLMPVRKSLGGYTINETAEPQSTETDERGNYLFENVPRGPYKLFWLPVGQTRWIRRIEFKPDVFVRSGEAAQIKAMRTALRTIN